MTPLDGVVDGARVKVAGQIEPNDQLLRAPISGRACAGWSVEVLEGPGTLLVEKQVQPFVLHDGSGRRALVHGEGARAVFEVRSWARAEPSTQRVRAFLARHHLRDYTRGSGLFPSFVFGEARLEPGETITVVGRARLELDPTGQSGSYREPPLRVVLAPQPRAPLWVLDSLA